MLVEGHPVQKSAVKRTVKRAVTSTVQRAVTQKKRAVKNQKVPSTKVRRSQAPQVLIIIRDLVKVVISSAEVVLAMGDTAAVVGINQRKIQVTKKKMFMMLKIQ